MRNNQSLLKTYLFLFLLIQGCLCQFAFGLSKPAKAIHSLLKHTLPNANAGIVLLEADSGKVLYEKHAYETFPPASNTKLLTAAAALLYLGADYRFETAIKKDDANHLLIQFSGDPSLTAADLKQLILELKKKGITQISQDIMIDDTRFQAPSHALGWTWDSLLWYYGAPVTTVILNENQIPITITSNKSLGEKAEVALVGTDTAHIALSSELITVSQAESETRCQFQMDTTPNNDVHLKGCWPYSATPITIKIAIKDPNHFMEQILLEALKTENIEFTGNIVYGKSSQGFKTLVTHYSRPLRELLRAVLEDTNNLYAESVTKTLGLARFQQGTFQAGTLAIKDILAKPIGSIMDTEVKLMDGSGLSFYNLITPTVLSRVLYVMYHDKKLANIFKDLLPVGGAGGTLANRMSMSDVKGKIRAKTGSLSGISTLAGYLTTLQGKNLIFVIMFDRLLHSKKEIVQAEDELCHLLMTSEW